MQEKASVTYCCIPLYSINSPGAQHEGSRFALLVDEWPVCMALCLSHGLFPSYTHHNLSDRAGAAARQLLDRRQHCWPRCEERWNPSDCRIIGASSFTSGPQPQQPGGACLLWGKDIQAIGLLPTYDRAQLALLYGQEGTARDTPL